MIEVEEVLDQMKLDEAQQKATLKQAQAVLDKYKSPQLGGASAKVGMMDKIKNWVSRRLGRRAFQ